MEPEQDDRPRDEAPAPDAASPEAELRGAPGAVPSGMTPEPARAGAAAGDGVWREQSASSAKGAATAVIGPLDEGTVRGLRTLLTAKIAAMIVLIAAVAGAGVLLAPQLGSVLGWTPEVRATVASLESLPPGDSSPGGCLRVRTHVTWAEGGDGRFVACAEGSGDAAGQGSSDQGSSDQSTQTGAAEAASPTAVIMPGDGTPVAVGDQVTVRALSGWETVVVGDRWPNAVLAAVLIALLAVAGIGLRRYLRERREMAALCGSARELAKLPARQAGLSMAFDVLTMGTKPGGGRGRRAMLRVVFDDPALAPLRLQVAGATQESMRWRQVEVYPTGTTRRGTPAGPYVLITERGTQVAAGRALRTQRASGR